MSFVVTLRGMRRRAKKFFFSTILAAMMLVAVLVCYEIGMRIIYHPAATKNMVSPELVYDPLLGWKGRAGFNGRVGPQQIEVSINGHGFRDGDCDEKLRRAVAEGRRKVLFIGGRERGGRQRAHLTSDGVFRCDGLIRGA